MSLPRRQSRRACEPKRTIFAGAAARVTLSTICSASFALIMPVAIVALMPGLKRVNRTLDPCAGRLKSHTILGATDRLMEEHMKEKKIARKLPVKKSKQARGGAEAVSGGEAPRVELPAKITQAWTCPGKSGGHAKGRMVGIDHESE